MAEVYAEFGFQISNKFPSVINEGLALMRRLGEIRVIETRFGAVKMEFEISCSNVAHIKEKSEELCEKLKPFVKDFQPFLQKESDKIYAYICFVRGESFEDIPVIQIDKRLLNLAHALQAEIHFDFFTKLIETDITFIGG